MNKSIYLEDVKYRMLEYIAKRNNKSLTKFLTEWSLQEYQEHEKKPFHRNLKNLDRQTQKEDTKNWKEISNAFEKLEDSP